MDRPKLIMGAGIELSVGLSVVVTGVTRRLTKLLGQAASNRMVHVVGRG